MSFQSKIRKPTGTNPDSFEKSVASLIFDIENNNKDLAAELKPLYITGAKEVCFHLQNANFSLDWCC